MKLIVGCTIFIFFLALTAAGQKKNNVWAFGFQSGLNFNTEPASYIKSKLEPENKAWYSSAISDDNGNLKIYTDGHNVWNRDGFKLPKFNNWWPWFGLDTVVPLIVPQPGNDSNYYIFGIGSGYNANKLIGFTTRMKNAGDIEEIVYPRPTGAQTFYTTLTSDASLLLAATAHCNQKDVWITTHTPGELKTFLITESGINPNPVVSNFSSLLPGGEILNSSNIKFSANGERLVIPLGQENKLMVLDFDNLTGKFSNPIKISVPGGEKLEDVELSPDGDKLYIGSYYTQEIDPGVFGADIHGIYQLDLEAGNASEIEQSVFKVNGFGDRVACVRTCFLMDRTMQLGPDGKIYISMRYTGGRPNLDLSISVIEDPNKKGTDCRYRMNMIKTKVQAMWVTFNYVRSGSFSLRENGIQIQKRTCADKPVEFALLYSRIDSVKWDFGDPSSGADNFSTELTPRHFYPASGSYTARAIIYSRCIVDTATKEVIVQPDVSVKVPAFIRDTFACVGQKLELDVTVPGATAYMWDNFLIFPQRVLDTAGSLSVAVFNDCSFDRKDFKFVYKECPCEVFIPTAFTPNNDGLNDIFKPKFECFAKDYKLSIYSRWGQVIYQAKEIDKGWNGKRGDLGLPAAVYVWVVEYSNPNTKEKFVKKGTVALIR